MTASLLETLTPFLLYHSVYQCITLLVDNYKNPNKTLMLIYLTL